MQGRACLFFWDTISGSFNNPVPVPDALITALKNVNGYLYVFSGSVSTGTAVSNGYRVSVYAGGQTLQQVHYANTGSPPLHGAVDSIGEKIMWGTFEQTPTTTPGSSNYYAVVKSFGSKDARFPKGIFTPIKVSGAATSSDGVVTALARVEQTNGPMVVGWRNATGYGLDKPSTTYGTSVFRTKPIVVNNKFTIRKIKLTLGTAVGSNMVITPKIFLDDFSSSTTDELTAINNANYSGERYVTFYPNISGDHNFVLELTWAGSALLPVLLPITIEFDVEDD
jgi:hypothetical protein